LNQIPSEQANGVEVSSVVAAPEIVIDDIDAGKETPPDPPIAGPSMTLQEESKLSVKETETEFPPVGVPTSLRRRRSRGKSIYTIDLERLSHSNDRISAIQNSNNEEDKVNHNDENNTVRSRHESVDSEQDSISSSGSHVPEPILFQAFTESRYFRSIYFAILGFVVMTLLVLGNLIYTFQYPFLC